METLRCEGPERAQVPSPVLGEETVGVILDDGHIMSVSHFEDRVHFAADACVVHRHNRMGAGRNL